jgi:RimJ/RimL family protein N-acetyltransferase
MNRSGPEQSSIVAATPPIRTPRLDLVAIPPEAIEHLLAGNRAMAGTDFGVTLPDEFPTQDELDGFLPIQIARMRREPAERRWMARLMIEREAKQAIGHCGFHGPPATIGRAEIGYTVFEQFRNRGFAKEAAGALAAWAFEEGEREVYASVSPDNAPSLAVVRALGFRQVGTQIDEIDGLEIVFALEKS